MPIEIRELVIRARIEPSRSADTTRPATRQGVDARTRKGLADDVMRILKDKRER
jgi:hypothetical protein